MEGTGVLSFDFEGGLETTTSSVNPSASVNLISTDSIAVSGGHQTAAGSSAAATEPVAGIHNGRRSFRQTVCRHWLRSLCRKGDACGFLHQFDKSRMPVCRFFRLYGECREQDCVYKHTKEDITECNMYKLGFCTNGPDCRYKHAKLPGQAVCTRVRHKIFRMVCQIKASKLYRFLKDYLDSIGFTSRKKECRKGDYDHTDSSL